MSEWVDVSVYAALIVTMWVWLPAWSARFAVPMLADRNADWVASRPAEVARITRGRGVRRLCLLWAVLSLGALIALQIGVWPERLTAPGTPKWEALKDLHSVLLIAGMVVFFGSAAIVSRWICATIPLAQRREAMLERRSLADYVPRAARIAVFGFVGIHVAAWLTVAALGRYSTPQFWGRMIAALVMFAACLFFVRLGVTRRPGAMDRIFGPAYRRLEVRFGFSIQLIPLIASDVRLFEEVMATPLVDLNRLLHLGLPLVVVAWAAALARATRHDAAPRPPRTIRRARLA